MIRISGILTAILLCFTSAYGAKRNQLSALEEEAGRNNLTKAGRQYHDKAMEAIWPIFTKAINACNRSAADTIEPATFIFVVAADGSVTKLVYSSEIPFGECLGAKLRTIKRLPRPPRDSWAMSFGVANHYHEQVAKGPPDKPMGMTRKQKAEYEKAIAPHVAKARATYPAAKKRYLAGLPPGYRFSIQIPLFDRDGIREDSFVLVEGIKDGNVTGKIQSELIGVKEFKTGQRITVPESKIINWVILRPDGVEEGNYVGKFLDHYKFD